MYKCVGGSCWQKEAEPVWSHSSWFSGHTHTWAALATSAQGIQVCFVSMVGELGLGIHTGRERGLGESRAENPNSWKAEHLES